MGGSAGGTILWPAATFAQWPRRGSGIARAMQISRRPLSDSPYFYAKVLTGEAHTSGNNASRSYAISMIDSLVHPVTQYRSIRP